MTTLAAPPETVDRAHDRLAGRVTGIGGILLVIWVFATIGLVAEPGLIRHRSDRRGSGSGSRSTACTICGSLLRWKDLARS